MINRNKYLSLRLFNFLNGFLITLIFIFIPKKKNRIIFTSTGNLKYDHNSKYLFEYFKKNYVEYQVKYVINDKTLKKKLEKEIGDYFISTNKLKELIYCMFSYTWITSSLETPVGGIFQRLNRLVIHLGHGTPLKNIGLLENNISPLKKIYYLLIRNNFSYILSTSSYFIEIMAKFMGVESNKIIVKGQPRNDSIFIEYKDYLPQNFYVKKGSKSILYAPTWRPKKETKIFPFSDISFEELETYLEKNNINIFLRVHPDFEEKIDEKIISLKRIYIIDSKKIMDISTYLSCFDLLITDYSSIFIDFLLLKKPVAFIPYDYEEYNTEIGFTVEYFKHTPGPKIKNFKEFKYEISMLLENKNYYLKERTKENIFYNTYQDNKNCERIAKFIIDKII